MSARWWVGCAAVLALPAVGCKRPVAPPPPVEVPGEVLRMAQDRPIPDQLQGRFSFRIRSEAMDLAASAGGVLVLDRPRGHLALMGPIGGPVVTLSSDGVGVSVVLPRERRQLLSEDARDLLQEAVGGLASMDDLFGLLAGDLPLEGARLLEQSTREEDVQVLLEGPQDSVLLVVLDRTNGTPRVLQAQRRDGERLLVAAWTPFQQVEGSWLPSEMTLEVPGLDLRLDLRYRNWRTLDAPPDVFGLGAPAGFVTEPLEPVLRRLAAEGAEQARTEAVEAEPAGVPRER